MPRRIAAAMSLLVFAVCLVAGMQADNPFTTTLSRALVAMAGTLVVGLIVGAMAQKMLDEHLAARRAALQAQAAEEAARESPPPGQAQGQARGATEQQPRQGGRGGTKNPAGREFGPSKSVGSDR